MKSLISLLSLFIIMFGNANIKSDKKIKIVFRFDDYQFTSTKFYDSLFYAFQKNNIPLCLGIVPYDKNGLIHNEMNQKQLDDLNLRIKRGEIEIALHGFNHNNNELSKGSFLVNPIKSEFARLEYDNQFKRINKAKKSIDSLLKINVNIFIPPYNTYDDNTLKVLDNLKFKIISAALNGSSSSDQIKYIPFTIDDLNELPKVIKKYQDDNILIVVLMHPYSFKGGGNYSGGLSKRIDFEQLDTLLNWINNQKWINVNTFSILNQNEIFDNKRFVLNSVENNLVIKILNKLKYYRYGIYSTVEYERSHKGILMMFNIILHIVTFLFIYFTSKIITKMLKPNKTIMFTFIVTMILIELVILYNRVNSFSFVTIAVFMTTVSTALFLGTISENKKLIKP